MKRQLEIAIVKRLDGAEVEGVAGGGGQVGGVVEEDEEGVALDGEREQAAGDGEVRLRPPNLLGQSHLEAEQVVVGAAGGAQGALVVVGVALGARDVDLRDEVERAPAPDEEERGGLAVGVGVVVERHRAPELVQVEGAAAAAAAAAAAERECAVVHAQIHGQNVDYRLEGCGTAHGHIACARGHG